MERLLNISFDIVQEEHKYGFFKYEPINSKLGSMFQNLGFT